MHKWVVISIIPVGQTDSTDWGSQTRWLENPRQEEALDIAWHSDNVPWPASQTAVTQCQALWWKWHVGVIAQDHSFVVPWSCGPAMISMTFLFSVLPTEKVRNGKERVSSALYFSSSYCGIQDCFLLSCLNLWKSSMRYSCSLEKTKHYSASAFSTSLQSSDVISKSQLGDRLPEGSSQAPHGRQDWQNCSRSAHVLEMQLEESYGHTYCTQLRAPLESPECKEGNYFM